MDELKHHSRVIDMLLTMHSVLRDRNSRHALLLDILLLISSVILATTVWLDPEVPRDLGFSQDSSKLVVGVSSTLVFAISLIHLRVDWKGTAERHQQAASSLARLKLQIRPLLRSDSDVDPSQIENQNRECALVLAILPPIPDRHFNRLKAVHKRKIELSKAVDKYPNLPLWLLRAKLVVAQMRTHIQTEKSDESS